MNGGLLSRIFGVALCLAPVLPAAQAESSLIESEAEVSQLRLALAAKAEDLRVMREKLLASDSVIKSLQKQLGIMGAESEVFRRQTGDLKLRLEAIGVDSAGGNLAKLQQRLLKAASDLSVLQQERDELHEALLRLSEAVIANQKSVVSANPDARLALEAELRGAAKALGADKAGVVIAEPVAPTLTDGMIVSVREDLACVVANVGAKQGVKVGMPFRIVRGSKPIGSVRIVDVREKIAGAVIQSFNSDEDSVKVGDRLMVEAN